MSPTRLPVPVPGLSAKEWRVLNLRYGFQPKATLEQIALKFGVTRQRINQVDAKAVAALLRFFRSSPTGLDNIEAALDGRRPASAIGKTGRAVVGIAIRSTGGNRGNLEKLAISVRAAAVNNGANVLARWPITSALFCGASPPIGKHPGVAAAIAKASAAKRPWSYATLARTVLERSGHPMHWKAMAEEAERLGHRRGFTRSGFYNALGASPGIFVRTDQGTYGLAKWGLQTVRQYVDIISDVLAVAQKPLGFGEIASHVNAERQIKEGSLHMFLTLHPRFYTSINGRHGLRVWLHPRHKQTLLTPSDFIESRDSFERVARSEARGYDVAGLIEGDRELPLDDYVAQLPPSL